MFKIEDFRSEPLHEAKFVKPMRLKYLQNGSAKSWEAVKSHDSVAVLLFHREFEAFLIVKQFRPPVYMNDNEKTFTAELCAGIIDKDKTIFEIAKDEILEECGFDIPLEKIERVTSFFTNVGISGSTQHLFFAEIDESMKISDGGGINEEEIYLEYIPLSESQEFIFNENIAKTPGLMFSFLWFFKRFNYYK